MHERSLELLSRVFTLQMQFQIVSTSGNPARRNAVRWNLIRNASLIQSVIKINLKVKKKKLYNKIFVFIFCLNCVKFFIFFFMEKCVKCLKKYARMKKNTWRIVILANLNSRHGARQDNFPIQYFPQRSTHTAPSQTSSPHHRIKVILSFTFTTTFYLYTFLFTYFDNINFLNILFRFGLM